MGWFSKLRGGSGSPSAAAAKAVAEEDYKGFAIRATSMRAGAEHQLAGEIARTVDGQTRTYTFVRADKFGSADDAAAASLAKGRQLIDEQGDRIFSQTWP